MHPDIGGCNRNQLCNVSLTGAQLQRAWGVGEGLVCYDRSRGGGLQPAGSPSLLLGNFSSCFLGTSYLEKRGRETLKASRWGPFCPGRLPCRHKVCAALSKNPSKYSPGWLWGGFLSHSPASMILTILELIGDHISSLTVTLSYSNVLRQSFVSSSSSPSSFP